MSQWVAGGGNEGVGVRTHEPPGIPCICHNWCTGKAGTEMGLAKLSGFDSEGRCGASGEELAQTPYTVTVLWGKSFLSLVSENISFQEETL